MAAAKLFPITRSVREPKPDRQGYEISLSLKTITHKCLLYIKSNMF